jgi:lysozyme family protein
MALTPYEQAKEIVRREGGWVDHKNDRGGATNYGISLRYAKGIGLDNDGDGDTDADDIRLVTVDQAIDLYLEDFFRAPKIDRFPEAIQPVLFDMAVNAGGGGAIKILQTMLGVIHDAVPDKVSDCGRPDGAAGRKTFRAFKEAWDLMGAKVIVNAYCDERKDFYRELVRRRPSQKVFLRGWLHRADEFYI